MIKIKKTLKMYVGGNFVRSESGRSFSVECAEHEFQLCLASRKDVRDSVEAASKGLALWQKSSPFLRSQVLYRVAEMVESRRLEWEELIGLLEPNNAAHEVLNEVVEAIVYYAGFSDKLGQVLGTVNQVSGPFRSLTDVEPTGVVGLVGDQSVALLMSHLTAILCAGNAVTLLLPDKLGILIGLLGEVLATSDVPAGTVNLLSGKSEELISTFASHRQIQAIAIHSPTQNALVKRAAVDNMKRVAVDLGSLPRLSLENITPFVEFKTTWHPSSVR